MSTKALIYTQVVKVGPHLVRRQLAFVYDDVRRQAADVEADSRPRDSVRHFLPQHKDLQATNRINTNEPISSPISTSM